MHEAIIYQLGTVGLKVSYLQSSLYYEVAFWKPWKNKRELHWISQIPKSWIKIFLFYSQTVKCKNYRMINYLNMSQFRLTFHHTQGLVNLKPYLLKVKKGSPSKSFKASYKALHYPGLVKTVNAMYFIEYKGDLPRVFVFQF